MMAITISRRNLLRVGYGTAATLGVSAVARELAPGLARAQGAPGDVSKEELFYRDDWFGEPWRKPETAVLIHGNDEIERRMVRMGAEDGTGVSPDPTGFAGVWAI